MASSNWRLDMGANVIPGGVEFRAWAPAARTVEVALHAGNSKTYVRLSPERGGIFSASIPGAGPGTRYMFRLDQRESYPDPYSRSQPEGVHGASEVVSPTSYAWSDGEWAGLGPEGLIVYECHVGAFTPEGTFDALAGELPELKRLGITAVELMPVAEFPGRWNWGYDGVDLYAPTRNYGGTEGLRRLVDAAHCLGLGVILDVVYNHLGPDGNHLRAYSLQYFTDRYRTPWGDALNFDGDGSPWVRHFVVQNACYWLNEYHIDGLRLDATHAIFDRSPRHILAEIAEAVRSRLAPGRRVVLTAENENNDVRLIRSVSDGGYGWDALWADDFHHGVRTLLTGENEGYYRDYPPSAQAVASTIKDGFLYQGQPSVHLQRRRGTPVTDEPAHSFVFCIQNHDQIGNRVFGDRLNKVVDRSDYAVASALLLLSPETPLIFMGQEFAASSPFRYFTDHKEELGRLVTQGRREEFKAFGSFRDPSARKRIPDPQAESTFRRSKVDLAERSAHEDVYRLYHELIALRKSDPVFARQDRQNLRAEALLPRLIVLHRWEGPEHRLLIANFGPAECLRFSDHVLLSRMAQRRWRLLWSSSAHMTARNPAQAGELRIPAACAVVFGSSTDP